MKGDLDMDNFKILNLKYNPTNESDAVNKHYVDTDISKSYIFNQIIKKTNFVF